MKRLVKIIFIVFLFISCSEESDSHPISEIRIEFYDNKGKNMSGNELKEYLKNLNVQIIPNDSHKLDFSYYNDKTGGATPIFVPLFYNTDKKYNKTIEANLNEEFKFILNYKGNEIFNKEFRLFYNNTNPPPIVTKIHVKNSKGKYIEYKPQKAEIKVNGKGLGIFFRVR